MKVKLKYVKIRIARQTIRSKIGRKIRWSRRLKNVLENADSYEMYGIAWNFATLVLTKKGIVRIIFERTRKNASLLISRWFFAFDSSTIPRIWSRVNTCLLRIRYYVLRTYRKIWNNKFWKKSVRKEFMEKGNLIFLTRNL